MLLAKGFKLRPDPTTSLIDVYIQIDGSQVERVILDPVVMRHNLESLKQYAAALPMPQDDSAQKSDMPVAEAGAYTNIVHASRVGARAETIFGLFSLHDWANALREDGAKESEVKSVDSVIVLSTTAFQKKLLQELLLAMLQADVQ
jgi:hypothetical protein